MNVGAHDGGVDDGSFPDKDVIPHLQREESDAADTFSKVKIERRRYRNSLCLPLAEFFKRRTNHDIFTDYTVTTGPDVRQIASDDGVRLDDDFTVQNDVLRSA